MLNSIGCLNGSSFLNDGFRELLKVRIEGEREYVEQNGYTFEGVLDVAVLEFEDKLKRRVDITSPMMTLQTVRIQGIRTNAKKRFRTNIVELNR